MIKLNVVVADGQGGRLGSLIVERLISENIDCEITAIGTNSIATASMLKSGAHRGATGEYPMICACEHADFILGPVGIAIPASLTGEVTPKMAEAVGRSRGEKILVPGDKCRVHIAGCGKYNLSEYAAIAVEKVKEVLK